MAVSSSPWGPFTDTGGPIVEHSWNCVACYIDPSYFRDPQTGKHYLLWKGDTLVQATITTNPGICSLDITCSCP